MINSGIRYIDKGTNLYSCVKVSKLPLKAVSDYLLDKSVRLETQDQIANVATVSSVVWNSRIIAKLWISWQKRVYLCRESTVLIQNSKLLKVCNLIRLCFTLYGYKPWNYGSNFRECINSSNGSKLTTLMIVAYFWSPLLSNKPLLSITTTSQRCGISTCCKQIRGCSQFVLLMLKIWR